MTGVKKLPETRQRANKVLKEFKEFAIKGNVVDLAVGVIIGAAFGGVVASLVKDIMMPPIGWLVGNVDFSNIFILLKAGSDGVGKYASLAEAQKAGAITVNVGLFLNTIIHFVIVGFAIFLLIRALNRLKRPEAPTKTEPVAKECSHCLMSIPIKATRCPHCTSELLA
jgi:large conductance mechanosensitive channel